MDDFELRESPELKAVVERLMRAVQRHDGATVANLLAPHAALRYIGTDPNEWWGGVELVDAYPQHLAAFPEFTYGIDELEAFESGPVGWAAIKGVASFAGEAPRNLRMTFVFALEGAFWRIIQLHLSVAVPNVETLGVELTPSLEQLLSAVHREAPDVELVGRDGTVTLVFTDITDSTQMAVQLGDGPWAELIEEHNATTASIVARHNGSVVKTLGDGAMISFGSTREAVRSAMEIRQASVDDGRVGVRIGVHVGDAMATGEDFVGTTVNKAARIAAAAGEGQIMVSSAVKVVLGDVSEFAFGSPITAELKGLSGVHEIWPLDLGGP